MIYNPRENYMATIELDIIKQRGEKLLPSERVELIRYLTATLTEEERLELTDISEANRQDRSDHDAAA